MKLRMIAIGMFVMMIGINCESQRKQLISERDQALVANDSLWIRVDSLQSLLKSSIENTKECQRQIGEMWRLVAMKDTMISAYEELIAENRERYGW